MNKKSILFCFLINLQLMFNLSCLDKSNHFVIVVPSYNNAKWYQRNIDSIINQTYLDYEVIYIDDCSSDATHDLVCSYVKQKGIEHLFRIIKNKSNQGAAYNRYMGVHLSKDTDKIVFLDGDDWFENNDTLKYLNDVYKDSNIWLTYGQFIHYPSGATSKVVNLGKDDNVRDFQWVFWHPKTFVSRLFKNIKLKDFLRYGDFFPIASDVAEILPMLEMAQEDHIKCLNKTLYTYNVHENNDFILNRAKQVDFEKYVRSLKKYPKLNELYKNLSQSCCDISFKNNLLTADVDADNVLWLQNFYQINDYDVKKLLSIARNVSAPIFIVNESVYSDCKTINLSFMSSDYDIRALDLRFGSIAAVDFAGIICKTSDFNKYRKLLNGLDININGLFRHIISKKKIILLVKQRENHD